MAYVLFSHASWVISCMLCVIVYRVYGNVLMWEYRLLPILFAYSRLLFYKNKGSFRNKMVFKMRQLKYVAYVSFSHMPLIMWSAVCDKSILSMGTQSGVLRVRSLRLFTVAVVIGSKLKQVVFKIIWFSKRESWSMWPRCRSATSPVSSAVCVTCDSLSLWKCMMWSTVWVSLHLPIHSCCCNWV